MWLVYQAGLDRKKKKEGSGRTGALRLSPLLTGDELSFVEDIVCFLRSPCLESSIGPIALQR